MRCLTSPPALCRRAYLACAAGIAIALPSPSAPAANTVALGDSLTAEYHEIKVSTPVGGFGPEETAYARVDREQGVVVGGISRSWVEVLGVTRPSFFNFGIWRNTWAPPRLQGFERNWGVPGATAARYREFMTTGFTANPLFFGFRIPLDQQLRTNTERVVIWLGTNDLREKYGAIYAEKDATKRATLTNTLRDQLIDDLERIIDRVQKLNSKAEIVVGNLPDLGATPKMIENFPNDPPGEGLPADTPREKFRGWVTTATETINTAIAALVEEKEAALADIYPITKNLIAKKPFFYGAIEFKAAQDAEGALIPVDTHNDPHYLFTRDGFHPNTALQIQIARTFIRAFNAGYESGGPVITQAEALKLLKIKPREPFLKWINPETPWVPALNDTRILGDQDGDGMTNLFEYAFDTNPAESNLPSTMPFSIGGPVEGINSEFSVVYQLPDAPRHEIDIAVQYRQGKQWIRIPAERLVTDDDTNTVQAAVPLTTAGVPVNLRIKVTLIPPQGSLNTIVTVAKVGVVTPTGL